MLKKFKEDKNTLQADIAKLISEFEAKYAEGMVKEISIINENGGINLCDRVVKVIITMSI